METQNIKLLLTKADQAFADLSKAFNNIGQAANNVFRGMSKKFFRQLRSCEKNFMHAKEHRHISRKSKVI